MIPNDPEEKKKMIDYMINSCKLDPNNLTDWEFEFISSIEEQFSKKNTLSTRQCEILEKIYDKLD